MESWMKLSLLLCAVGFLNSMVPSEHFVLQYLTDFRDIPADKVTTFFFAPLTYWNAALLIVFLMITDIARYKLVIILSIAAGIVFNASMRWTEGVNALLFSAFAYGLMMASEVAYMTYIYAKVDEEHYQQVTSNTRSALLFGRCAGAFLSQFLMMYNVMNPLELIYISFGNKCLALVIALFLPAVTTSVYFYQKHVVSDARSDTESNHSHPLNVAENEVPEEQPHFSWTDAKSLFIVHLRSAFTNKIVLLWSIWWILLNTGNSMVYIYAQPLWYSIEPERKVTYNGFAEAGLTLFGALGSLAAAKLSQERIERWAIGIVIICSIGLGSMAIVAGQTGSVFVSYAMYVSFGALYNFMITVTSAIVAKNLELDSFGMIFGLNRWVSSVLVSIFSFLVVSHTFFQFNPRELYTIFGSYFYALVMLFGVIGMIECSRRLRIKRRVGGGGGE